MMYRQFMIFLLCTSLFGGKLEWTHSYKEAQKRAINENKVILLLITTKGCRWCRKLENTTLQDDEVTASIGADFIPLHLTRDIDDYPTGLKAKMVPASFFLYHDGKQVMRSVAGYWPAEDYLSILDDVKRKIKRTGDIKQ